MLRTMLIQEVLHDRSASARVAVVAADREVTLSYAQFSRMCRKLAADFLRAGARPGDRVAILLPDSIEFVAALFGALTAGLVVVPMDVHLRKVELLAMLGLIRPRILMT